MCELVFTASGSLALIDDDIVPRGLMEMVTDCGKEVQDGETTSESGLSSDSGRVPTEKSDVDDEDEDSQTFGLDQIKIMLVKCRTDASIKPNMSYIALIALAIQSTSRRKMLLAEIYEWVHENVAYYRVRQKSWRNSIRHNLSLNECFIKAGRSDNGKGNYWTIHPACADDFLQGDFRRRRARRLVRKCEYGSLDQFSELLVAHEYRSADSGSANNYFTMTSTLASGATLVGAFGAEAILTRHEIESSRYPIETQSLPKPGQSGGVQIFEASMEYGMPQSSGQLVQPNENNFYNKDSVGHDGCPVLVQDSFCLYPDTNNEITAIEQEHGLHFTYL